ncbi:hypothetical protein [Allohahella sp. A8]
MKTRIRKAELLMCALVVLVLGLAAQVVVNVSEINRITAGEQK